MRKIIIAALISMVIISGCVQEEPVIGGERDEHGCLGPAGYTYDEELDLCARSWEIVSDDQRTAITIASQSITDRDGLTLVEMISQDCEGCFLIKFSRYQEQMDISVENWTVK